jgi:hypothetical protein
MDHVHRLYEHALVNPNIGTFKSSVKALSHHALHHCIFKEILCQASCWIGCVALFALWMELGMHKTAKNSNSVLNFYLSRYIMCECADFDPICILQAEAEEKFRRCVEAYNTLTGAFKSSG